MEGSLIGDPGLEPHPQLNLFYSMRLVESLKLKGEAVLMLIKGEGQAQKFQMGMIYQCWVAYKYYQGNTMYIFFLKSQGLSSH